MRFRLIVILRKYAILILIGIAYLIWVMVTNIRIPCVFYTITGLKCPACGITRMLVCIAQFDFKDAFYFNPFVFIALPPILCLFIYSEIKYVLTGDRSIGKLNAIYYVGIVLAIAYGVLRNLPL